VFKGNNMKAVTFSYDDGVEQDKRLIQLLNKYNLKCTFNLNSGCKPAQANGLTMAYLSGGSTF